MEKKDNYIEQNDKIWIKPEIFVVDVNVTASGLANTTESEGGNLS